MKKKKPIVLAVLLIFLLGIFPVTPLLAESITGPYYTKIARSDGTFSSVVGSYNTLSAAIAAMNNSSDPNMVVMSDSKLNGGVVAMKDGIAVSRPVSATMYLYAAGTSTGDTYIPSSHTLFYYSTTSETRVKIGISGYIGEANLSEVMLIPRAHVRGQSYYYVDGDNDIMHRICVIDSSNTVNYYTYTYLRAPSFMVQGVHYYSLDGKTFYTDPQLKRPVGTVKHYYNMLPVRSKTNYTAAELNFYMTRFDHGCGKMAGKGQAFIDAQNKYGVNAAILMSIAFLESAYGRSNFAVHRNNLFGISAYDINPNNATHFDSVEACIDYMGWRMMSQGYCDAKTDVRYSGANLGNKLQGFNVKYASDPYWGQKIAGLYYKIDRWHTEGYKTGYKDLDTYQLGVSNQTDYVYYNPAVSSNWMYRLARPTGSLSISYYNYPTGIPVIILDSSNSNFYKIQSDMPINDSGVTSCYDHSYNWNTDVGYVAKSSINILAPSAPIVMPVDKAALNAAIAEAAKIDQTKYSPESVATLTAANAAAVAVRDNASATQVQVDKATADLNAAIQNLVWIADKTALNAIINTASAVDKTKYTDESVARLDSAYAAAVAVRDTQYPSQSDVDAATANLQSAYDSLALYVAVASVAMEKDTLTITEGLMPVQLRAAVVPENASVKGLIWSSSDPSVATVSETGELLPLKNGTTTITVKSADSRVSISDECTVTIELRVPSSTTYHFDTPASIVSKVPQNTNVADFLNHVVLPEGTTAQVHQSRSQVSDGPVATGMVLKVYKGIILQGSYDISVRGDINGDGITTISDLVSIRAHLLGTQDMTGIKKLSGDMNNDGNVTISDLVSVRAFLLGL